MEKRRAEPRQQWWQQLAGISMACYLLPWGPKSIKGYVTGTQLEKMCHFLSNRRSLKVIYLGRKLCLINWKKLHCKSERWNFWKHIGARVLHFYITQKCYTDKTVGIFIFLLQGTRILSTSILMWCFSIFCTCTGERLCPFLLLWGETEWSESYSPQKYQWPCRRQTGILQKQTNT